MKKDRPKVKTHLFVPGESNLHPNHPEVLCAVCSTPRGNTYRHHDLEPQDQAVTDHERRRIGDKS